MIYFKSFSGLCKAKAGALLVFLSLIFISDSKAQTIDSIAERMLIYQRSSGGWPKAINEKKIIYENKISREQLQQIRSTVNENDGTFDNKATSREIRYLISAFKLTGNEKYFQAAQKGIDFIFAAQYENGGWPQYYPDKRLYRAQVTFNDDAMVNILNILQDIAENKGDYSVFEDAYIKKANAAISKALTCIVKSQITVGGKLTAWGSQYDEKTLTPAKARAFEPVSITSSESVGIARFLMRIKNPSDEIKTAIIAAVKWFDEVKIVGFNTKRVEDTNLPKGFDLILVEDPANVFWARFYDLKTQEPIFSDRTEILRKRISEIEYERRVGYSWYGIWPEKLITKEFPNWRRLNNI
ncbi:pectate lyase [Paradesertivirga mongoliensis]|uniref:Pectate lyase n=1 Tax=Paradesertivirga mongoliensis TaxID=2100740 RepID=A0ABW4ZKN7_9SPHI|nr:pectate lyase [Pedobacter mongoliensis]